MDQKQEENLYYKSLDTTAVFSVYCFQVKIVFFIKMLISVRFGVSIYQKDFKRSQPDSDDQGLQKKQRHCRSVHVLRLIQDSELFTLYAPLRGVLFQS